jgi:hypothetical protein
LAVDVDMAVVPVPDADTAAVEAAGAAAVDKVVAGTADTLWVRMDREQGRT